MTAERRWQVELLPRAIAGLEEILREHGDDAFDQVLSEILALGEDPTPEDSEPLRSIRHHYRIYVYRSLYRAVYRVLSTRRVVLVERVGPRRSVYIKGGYERW